MSDFLDALKVSCCIAKSLEEFASGPKELMVTLSLLILKFVITYIDIFSIHHCFHVFS
jgi:hypothetical protein